MANPILEISDGVTSVNLLEPNGIMLTNWIPAITDLKNSGVWQDNPMADNRRLVIQNFSNVVETMTLAITTGSQDLTIEKSQKLRRLLQAARDYWTSDRNDARPVYIKARAPYETNTRYAIIYDWRTPNDSNPFTMPFFNCGQSTSAELTLVMERGHWMSKAPMESDCVMISNQQDYSESGVTTGALVTKDSYPLYNIDGAMESCGPNTAATATYQCASGYSEVVVFGAEGNGVAAQNLDWEMAIRFQNVDVPKNAKIDAAYIEFIAAADSTAVTQTARMFAEKTKEPAYFPVYSASGLTPTKDRYYGTVNTTPVPLTLNYVDWDIPELNSGDPYNSDSIVSIIQEVIDSSYWESGLDIIIYFRSVGNVVGANDDRKSFRGTLFPNTPSLHVEYHVKTGFSYGQEETCGDRTVFVSNKHNRANLSHAFYYDTSGSSFSANLMEAGLPYAFLPAVPAAGDYVVFGIDFTLENSGPFCSIVFDIDTVSDDVHGHWEYYNGASWVELQVTDNTVDIVSEKSFTVAGVRSVHWIQPSNWGVVAVNSVTGYWVKYYVDSVDATPVPPTQHNRVPYTVVTPFVDIDDAQIGGDIPALAEIRFQNMSDDFAYDVKLQATRVIAALRSKERGSEFTPFINFYSQNLTQCVINSVDASTSTEQTPISQTGTTMKFEPAAAFTLAKVIEIIFQGEELSNYIGYFRAFLRTRTYDATSGTVTAKLAMRFGEGDPTFYTDEITIVPTADQCTITDMGLFTINPGTLNPNEQYTSGTIEVYLSSDSSDGTTVHLLDLILMPADEWICDTHSRSSEALRMFQWHGSQRELRIDGIGNPRYDVRCVLVDDLANDLVLDEWPKVASSSPILQANKDQRLWFLVFDTDRDVSDVCAFEAVHAVQVNKSQRYFSMRGSR